MSRRTYHIPLVRRPQEQREKPPTYLFPVDQPVRVQPRQQPPSTWTPILGATVVPPANSYLFATAQPSWRPSYRVVTRPRAVAGQLPSVSAKQPFIYPISQPDRKTFYTEPARYQSPVVNWNDLNPPPPPVPNAFVPFTQAHHRAWGWPQVVGPWTPITGPPPAPLDVMVFRSESDYPLAYRERPKPRLIVRSIHGTTRNTLDPIKAVLDQPDPRRWEVARRPIIITNRFDDVSLIPKQTYVFPLDQPSRRFWYLDKPTLYAGSPVRTEGPPRQDQLVFVPKGVETVSWLVRRLQLRNDQPLTGLFAPPPTPQSYVFEPNQPSRAYWYVPRLAAVPIQAFRGEGATSYQTYIFPLDQPDRRAYYARRSQLEIDRGGLTGIFIPPIPIIDPPRTPFLSWNAEPLTLRSWNGTVLTFSSYEAPHIVVTWNIETGTVTTWNMETMTFTSYTAG